LVEDSGEACESEESAGELGGGEFGVDEESVGEADGGGKIGGGKGEFGGEAEGGADLKDVKEGDGLEASAHYFGVGVGGLERVEGKRGGGGREMVGMEIEAGEEEAVIAEGGEGSAVEASEAGGEDEGFWRLGMSGGGGIKEIEGVGEGVAGEEVGGGEGGGEVGWGILERRERRLGGFLGGGVAWPAEGGDELEKGSGAKVEKAGGGMETEEDELGGGEVVAQEADFALFEVVSELCVEGVEDAAAAFGEDLRLGERDMSEGFGDAERGDVEDFGEKQLGGDELFEGLVRVLGHMRPFRNYQTFLLRKTEVLR
jgi:hypothetical protein